MPLYEFRCPICDDTFTARRTMSEASDPIECPEGHPGSRRLLSMFASVGSGSGSAPTTVGAPRPSGGGCCGGACGC